MISLQLNYHSFHVGEKGNDALIIYLLLTSSKLYFLLFENFKHKYTVCQSNLPPNPCPPIPQILQQQQPSIIECFLSLEWDFMSLFLLCAGILAGLILCRSNTHSHSHWELMCAMTLMCSANSVSLYMSTAADPIL